jgi:signal transduction histidine kinase
VTNLIQAQKRELVLLAVIAILFIFLTLLAAIQYRWIGQLSEAERLQLKENLQVAAARFCQDFNSELSSVSGAFLQQPGNPDSQQYNVAGKYIRWASSARYPHLIKNIWLVALSNGAISGIQKFSREKRSLEDSSWPPELNRIKDELQNQFQRNSRPEMGRNPDRRAPPLNMLGLATDDPPALILPVFPDEGGLQNQNQRFGLQQILIITLELNAIRQEILPALVSRYFPGESGLMYRITLVRKNDANEIVFRTNPSEATAEGPGQMRSTAPDVSMELFSIRPNMFPGPAGEPRPQNPEGFRMNEPPDTIQPENRGPAPGPERPGFGPRGLDAPFMARGGDLWELQIRHRAGSLEAAVARARYRNLAVSFGILLLLGGSIVSIAVSSRHAHWLAQQQVEFVAAVTHELRTPIAVIQTAGQNLADGVIRGDEQTIRYGALIGAETRRLASMIEKVLEFAREQNRTETLELVKLPIDGLIESSISGMQPLIAAGKFEILREIESDLPKVLGDQASLRIVLQNLIENAMKYSGTSRQITIKAQMRPGSKGPEIHISIADHGIGIPADELPRIFDPFFRGKEVASIKVRGSGLGLSLVKGITEAHNGRISVNSTLGHGTTISIALAAVSERPNGGNVSAHSSNNEANTNGS